MKNTLFRRTIIGLMLTSILTMPVFASNSDNLVSSDVNSNKIQNFTVSEYEMIVKDRSISDEELQVKGYSDSEIVDIKSDKAEQELLRRAQLSDEELKSNFYYNDDQINILRAYDGTPIQENPQLQSVLATMSGSVSVVNYSTSTIWSKMKWNWSTAPIFCGTDMVAARWQGTDTSGNPLNVALNNSISKSYCLINYQDQGVIVSPTKKQLTTVNAYSSAKCSFDIVDSSYAFAKTGEIQVAVDRTGTSNIKEIAICYSYGHSTITASGISVSFPLGFSIEFTGTVDKMLQYAKRIKSDGTMVNY